MICLALLLLPSALAADGDDDGGGSAADSRFALSVGTGPRPLNTLTFGLTGLAGRIALPVGRAVPWLGLSVQSFSGADFEEGEREDRYVSTASSLHGSLGIRV